MGSAHRPIVEMLAITKEFAGVRALEAVDFSVLPGEVHVLLGENGAGKSTLIKILSGVFPPTAGEVHVDGRPVVLRDPRAAQALGIGTIYQEFNLVPYLTVAQNIFLGNEIVRAGPGSRLDHDRMRREARRALETLQAPVDPDALVASLGVAQQQMVEVAKALIRRSRVLIMDEPTAALSQREIEHLFNTIRLLKAQGVGIVYISHRLQEVHEIGDRVTVLRDGRLVGTRRADEVDVPGLVQMMVGRRLDTLFPRTFVARGEEVLRVVDLRRPPKLNGASLVVHTGEIVGLAGLVGAGRTELARAIFGVDPIASGEVHLFGRLVRRPDPPGFVDAGVAFLPEDRKHEGLVLALPISENVVLASWRKLFPWGLISIRREEVLARQFLRDLRIGTPSVRRLCKYLSGGNQQKVVLAKWLATRARLFIFDEPTRGIDVGAKAEIHQFMNELVNQGAAILMISSELPEVLGMSDRIYVMRDGRIVAEFGREDATQEAIISAAMGPETPGAGVAA